MITANRFATYAPITNVIDARRVRMYDVLVIDGFFGPRPMRVTSITRSTSRAWITFNDTYTVAATDMLEIDADGNGHMSRMLADDPLMMRHQPGDTTPWFFLML